MHKYGDERAGLKSSRGGLVAAGVIVVLIALMGVYVAISGPTAQSDPPRSESGDSTTPPQGSSSDHTDPAASLCGLAGEATEGNLNSPPSDATWLLQGRIAVPTSKSAGPGRTTEDGMRYCYAHTPEGALLAAMNVYSWDSLSQRDPVAVVEHGVAAGPGYNAAIKEARKGGPENASKDFYVQIRGFRLLAYSGSGALVDIGLQTSDGVYAHQAIELIWDRGDWRMRMAPDGSAPAAQQLPDLTGYIPWAGA